MWPAQLARAAAGSACTACCSASRQPSNYPLSAETSPKVPCGTLEEAKAAFLEQHGSSYGYKGWMEQRWQEEIGDRLGQGQHYLDYTGDSLNLPAATGIAGEAVAAGAAAEGVTVVWTVFVWKDECGVCCMCYLRC